MIPFARGVDRDDGDVGPSHRFGIAGRYRPDARERAIRALDTSPTYEVPEARLSTRVVFVP